MDRARMLLALLLTGLLGTTSQAQSVLEISSSEAKKIFGIEAGKRIPLSADRAIEVAMGGESDELPSILKINIREEDRQALEKKIQSKEAQLQVDAQAEVAKLEKSISEIKQLRVQLQKEMLSSSEIQKGPLARKIYENVLKESNLQSQVSLVKDKVAKASVWKFEVDRIGEVRSVREIRYGQELVWSRDLADKTNSVASAGL